MATARPTPIAVKRALAQAGTHLATWRRLQQLTSDQVADRAGVSRTTLHRLESGAGASLENTLRVARALGVLDLLVGSIDPYNSDVGRLRADEELPQRVRRPAQPRRQTGAEG
jgi:transcriptional regulator with XRE-family HTH domain